MWLRLSDSSEKHFHLEGAGLALGTRAAVALVLLLAVFFSGCSVKSMAMGTLANSLPFPDPRGILAPRLFPCNP